MQRNQNLSRVSGAAISTAGITASQAKRTFQLKNYVFIISTQFSYFYSRGFLFI